MHVGRRQAVHAFQWSSTYDPLRHAQVANSQLDTATGLGRHLWSQQTSIAAMDVGGASAPTTSLANGLPDEVVTCLQNARFVSAPYPRPQRFSPPVEPSALNTVPPSNPQLSQCLRPDSSAGSGVIPPVAMDYTTKHAVRLLANGWRSYIFQHAQTTSRIFP